MFPTMIRLDIERTARNQFVILCLLVMVCICVHLAVANHQEPAEQETVPPRKIKMVRLFEIQPNSSNCSCETEVSFQGDVLRIINHTGMQISGHGNLGYLWLNVDEDTWHQAMQKMDQIKHSRYYQDVESDLIFYRKQEVVGQYYVQDTP